MGDACVAPSPPLLVIRGLLDDVTLTGADLSLAHHSRKTRQQQAGWEAAGQSKFGRRQGNISEST